MFLHLISFLPFSLQDCFTLLGHYVMHLLTLILGLFKDTCIAFYYLKTWMINCVNSGLAYLSEILTRLRDFSEFRLRSSSKSKFHYLYLKPVFMYPYTIFYSFPMLWQHIFYHPNILPSLIIQYLHPIFQQTTGPLIIIDLLFFFAIM